MGGALSSLGFLRQLGWQDALSILAVVALARLLALLARRGLGRLAEGVSPHRRLAILRIAPLARLAIDLATVVIVVPMLVEPTFRNVAALLAAFGLALAFAFKDYASCLVAGVVAVLENAYQPGDWIELDGAYGEVKAIGLRAVHLVTPDDTEVIVPHSRLWSAAIHNASGGSRRLLCVTDFYLHPDHDAQAAGRRLAQIAESSSYRKPETKATVIVKEEPWGTHYRVKAHVRESREQFLFTTDITMRGKEALRAMQIQFAQAPFAKAGKG